MKNLLLLLFTITILYSCNFESTNQKSSESTDSYDYELVDAKTWMMVEPHINNSNCYPVGDYYVKEIMMDTIPEAAFKIIKKNDKGQRVEIIYNDEYWLVNVFDYADYEDLSINKLNVLVRSNNYYIKDGLPVKKITCVGSHGFLSMEYESSGGKTFVYCRNDKWKILRGHSSKPIKDWIAQKDSLEEEYSEEFTAIKHFFEEL